MNRIFTARVLLSIATVMLLTTSPCVFAAEISQPITIQESIGPRSDMIAKKSGTMSTQEFLIAYYDIIAERMSLPSSWQYIDLKNTQAKKGSPLYRSLQKGVMMGLSKNQVTNYKLKSQAKQELFARMVERDFGRKLIIVNGGALTYEMLSDTLKDIASNKSDVTIESEAESAKPLLKEVEKLLEENYYQSDLLPTSTKREQDAISGMIDGIGDPYTQYYRSDDTPLLKNILENSLVGVGMTLEKEGDFYKISQVLTGSPAENGGILSGDIIRSVDGSEINSKLLTIENVVSRIRGEEGSSVVIVLQRGDQMITKTLIRKKIQIPNIAVKNIDSKTYYAKIQMFASDMDLGELTKGLNSALVNKNSKLIIDLRSNPGGSIESYRNIANLFIPSGENINYFVTRSGKQSLQSSGDARFQKSFEKIIILVNKSSASAAEMLTLALKEYNGAIVIGEQTFGKGVAQQIVELSDGSTLKYTFAEWVSGKNNTSINKIGIRPDIIIENKIGEDTQLQKAIAY